MRHAVLPLQLLSNEQALARVGSLSEKIVCALFHLPAWLSVSFFSSLASFFSPFFLFAIRGSAATKVQKLLRGVHGPFSFSSCVCVWFVAFGAIAAEEEKKVVGVLRGAEGVQVESWKESASVHSSVCNQVRVLSCIKHSEGRRGSLFMGGKKKPRIDRIDTERGEKN
mmetsp:Transcript_25611/g.50100  ORF Transcript_25611/g.50100 Transcript_25611/m.50100 type:complete len:168 (-) Transcript_25611:987-1490(-)